MLANPVYAAQTPGQSDVLLLTAILLVWKDPFCVPVAGG